MTKYITGIGGFFFRSKDPSKLKDWYINILGIDIQNHVWEQQSGDTVFEPFDLNTDYFKADHQWMLNFRVSDLYAFISELKNKGVEVEQKDEWNSMPEVGKFARIHDLEGNPIELWEPAKK